MIENDWLNVQLVKHDTITVDELSCHLLLTMQQDNSCCHCLYSFLGKWTGTHPTGYPLFGTTDDMGTISLMSSGLLGEEGGGLQFLKEPCNKGVIIERISVIIQGFECR